MNFHLFFFKRLTSLKICFSFQNYFCAIYDRKMGHALNKFYAVLPKYVTWSYVISQSNMTWSYVISQSNIWCCLYFRLFVNLFKTWFPGIYFQQQHHHKKVLNWNTTKVMTQFKQRSNVLECIFISAICILQFFW